MLEALLKHFRSYGMHDLDFIIVNSKLSHSQDKLHELQKRVSFDVYQETDEEEVWSVMDGNKDDMYVYDRCGRLTYFIPFPRSILTESPLVSNAILATYFRSPCGANCNQNKTLEMNEFVKNMENDFEESNNTEQESVVTEITEEYITFSEVSNETLASNDLFAAIDSGIGYDVTNSSDVDNTTDYDYSTFNVSSHLNETNSTSIDKARTFFSRLYELFFNGGNSNETFRDTNGNSTLNATTLSNETSAEVETGNDMHHRADHPHHKHANTEETETDQRDKKKSDRCLEADYEVCKSWSKKRLLHAQKCCSSTHSGADHPKYKLCSNFGKKRCKKIQSILKCCIKTVYAEPTTTAPTKESTQATETTDIVCCKTIEAKEKLCRVVTFGECDEDEERSPSTSK